MRQKIEIAALVVTLILVGFTPSLLTAQVALDDQLKAQYNMVKMGADSSGTAVVEAGTLLDVKKGGILAVPYSDQSFTPTKYQDGVVHSPNALVQKGIGGFMKKLGKEQNTKFFQVGEKVYPSHIDVNMAKDTVTMGVVACDSCNNTQSFYKTDVVFQFAKGQLAKMSAPQVEDAISGLLAIDEGGDQGQGGNGNDQQGNNQGGGGGGGGGQAQQGPPPEPQQIDKGQTPDQVKAALGPPEKIVNLGAKQIYVYKDLKVTFVNGKVSDVQ